MGSSRRTPKSQSASQVKPASFAASSSAAVAVGLARHRPTFVPSQGVRCRRVGVVYDGARRSSRDRRRSCLDDALHTQVDGDGRGDGAAGAATSGDERSATGSAVRRSAIESLSHPFLEGRMGFDRGQVSWLRAPRRAFPERRQHSSGSCDASAPVHSGGTARDSHRTSLDHRPLNGASIPHPVTPSHGRYNRSPRPAAIV